jgi:S-formylglutathione hydrolase FrmB
MKLGGRIAASAVAVLALGGAGFGTDVRQEFRGPETTTVKNHPSLPQGHPARPKDGSLARGDRRERVLASLGDRLGRWSARWAWGAGAGRCLIAGLLVFSAALAVGGTAGTIRYVGTFWLYRGFPAPSTAPSVAISGLGGTRHVRVVPALVESFSVASPALAGFRDRVYVVLPPGYAQHPRQRYPVLYLLHGFPGDPTNFLTIGGVAGTEATLIAAGRMKPVILVMPGGTRSFFADKEWANGVRPGNGWETFVARDLVHAVDARYRTISAGAARGIAGLSEGGYAALNIGVHHPGEFGALESWSGYMVADHKPAIFGSGPRLLRYNSPAHQVSLAAARLRAAGIYIWFYCGTSDELAAQNHNFSVKLTILGIAHHFFERPGTHTWRLWRELMPLALITASGHLSHG